MNDPVFNDIALERIAGEEFGLDLKINKVIARGISVSHTARATVLLTNKKQLFCYITAQSNLSLGDIKKIITRMGLRAELYVPPKGRLDYFDEIGRKHFSKVFPGMRPVSDRDLNYYRTLAPYNPALVLIKDIPNSEIRQFDTDATGNWRTATKFAYRRIKTS